MDVEAIRYYDADISTLVMPVKRYAASVKTVPPSSQGLVLFFAHATGMHKEQWEPIIEKLLQCSNVREAYAFDWPSHGEGASLNSEVMSSFDPIGVATWDWGRLIAGFHKAHNFNPQRTIGIGHSGGCTALLHSTISFPLDSPPYACMIHFEPTMISRKAYANNLSYMENALASLQKSIGKRRESWANRTEALAWLSGRPPWRDWDHRVLALFVDHALGEVNTDGNSQVGLLCAREQEVTAYRNLETQFQALEQYGRLDLPVHFVLGERISMVPQFQHDSNMDPDNCGRSPTSLHKIPGGTHLVVQERPDECARVIADLLDEYISMSKARL